MRLLILRMTPWCSARVCTAKVTTGTLLQCAGDVP